MNQLEQRFGGTVHIGTAIRAALVAVACPAGTDGFQTELPGITEETRRDSSFRELMRIETGGRHAKSKAIK